MTNEEKYQKLDEMLDDLSFNGGVNIHEVLKELVEMLKHEALDKSQ